MNGKRFLPAVIFGLLMLAGACSYRESWIPAGQVNIAGFHESDTSLDRTCAVWYSIKNTGKSTIESSTVSFSIKTDSTTYYKTVAVTDSIDPGSTIWEELDITYFNTAETTSKNNIKILDCFFD